MATYFFKNGRDKVSITADGLYISHRQIPIFSGDTGRDEIWAGQLGNAHKTVATQANSKAAQTAKFGESITVPDPNPNNAVLVASVNGGMIRETDSGGTTTHLSPATGFDSPSAAGPLALDGAEASYAPAQLSDAAMEQSDSFTHVKPRDRWVLRTLCEFWSAATVGRAQKADATLTNGSATVVLPHAGDLVIGQAVTGSNIPAGAHIVGIMHIPAITESGTDINLMSTKVTLSHKATATTSEELTFTGSDLVARAWLDEMGPVTNDTIKPSY